MPEDTSAPQWRRTARKAAAVAAIVIAVGLALVVLVPIVLVGLHQSSEDRDARGAAESSSIVAFQIVTACTADAVSSLPAGAAASDAGSAFRDCVDEPRGRSFTEILQQDMGSGGVTFAVKTSASATTGGGSDWFAGSGDAGGCWSLTIDAGARAITALGTVSCVDAGSSEPPRNEIDVAAAGGFSPMPFGVGPETSGEVTSLRVTTGDTLEAGDVVAEIDGLPIIAYPGPGPLSSEDGWTPDEDNRAEGAWTRDHAIQHILARLGYYEGQLDGAIGSNSREAIRQFNADQGIDSDELDESRLVWIGDVEPGTERTDHDAPVVTAIYVSEGDAISAGDPLFALGRRD
ncbi:peptidoglycan-binding protein [Demequina aestuarii]|uniref:peptidoglycan-binding protein n=1 Tax=Demequina aestuarii TaxID=327095 RepID=UPI000781ACA6|nr:peptidoglycan-binding protein [Demequina aestuarii]